MKYIKLIPILLCLYLTTNAQTDSIKQSTKRRTILITSGLSISTITSTVDTGIQNDYENPSKLSAICVGFSLTIWGLIPSKNTKKSLLSKY